ncbi:MAG: c-type cytochrome [Acidobacteria bacterium]|nr:c-type cytochrome [Acidobacteriota bacterium]
MPSKELIGNPSGTGPSSAGPQLVLLLLAFATELAAGSWCSPYALAVTSDGKTLYVACATANRVEVFDTALKKVIRTIDTPAPATGLVLSHDAAKLYVTCAAPVSKVLIIDTASGKSLLSVSAGHTAEAPTLSPDGSRLYVSNKFSGDVSVIDTKAAKELRRLQAVREPMGSALSKDGRLLFVINSVPAGRADAGYVAAGISIFDTAAFSPAGRIQLPNGSAELRAIDVSPDGAYGAVTHLLARYYLPTTQLERGWMETNALSILDVPGKKLLATVLLDEPDLGAANPWAVRFSADGRQLVVSHAGTHEISLIDAAALIKKIKETSRETSDDLSFLAGLRKRIQLQGRGPRALALAGNRAYACGYFSDTLEEIDLKTLRSATIAELPTAPMTVARRGEMLFNDGSICFQGWQSCSSCHSPDARVDALNWDLMNDGLGNPKNVKSLLFAHRTPPAMSHGVRGSAELAVRAGIRYILFTVRPEEDAVALDEFLKSLQPVPSPHLVSGKLSPAAERGKALFMDSKVGCAKCHPPGLYTDLQTYDTGTRAPTDSSPDFDTPTLVEVWRTAPYLHNGSSATLRDVLTIANPHDKHGRTSHLTPTEIDDLVAFLLSL